MSSIRPTISARTTIERVALFALGVASLAVLVVSVREAQAAHSRALGLAATEQAAAMQRGPVRDQLLDRAQAGLGVALEVYSHDAALWLAMARTRYLQATGAEVTEISPALLEASVIAARRAEALDPESYEAPARMAQAFAVWPDAQVEEGASALARSYARRPFDAYADRIESAAMLWPHLDEAARTAALAEGCLIARSGDTLRVQAAAMSAPAFSSIMQTPSCAPAAAPQNQDSSPQIQP